MRETKYRSFVDRYYEFREEDIVDVCESHHAEIHEIYDKIIQRDLRRTGVPLRNYTWTMAENLMERLITRCNQWLDEETPGSRHGINGRKRKSKGGFQAAVRTLQQKRGKQ